MGQFFDFVAAFIYVMILSGITCTVLWVIVSSVNRWVQMDHRKLAMEESKLRHEQSKDN